MKKLLTLLISSSLVLSAGLKAQQAEESPAPSKKHPGKGHPAEDQPASGARPPTEARPAKEAATVKDAAPSREAAPIREAAPAKEAKQAPIDAPTEARPKGKRAPKTEAAPKTKTREAETPAVTDETAKPLSTPEVPAVTKTPEAPAATAKVPAGKRKKDRSAAASPAPEKTASPAAMDAAASSPALATEKAPKANGKVPKLEKLKVEKIKTEHANFKAEPKPDLVPTVTFTESRRLEGSDQWRGEKYGVYRSYRPERHDEGYYHSHYKRVELISGGYYYLDKGYWYPAWGYDTSHQYYAYDAPVYAGHRAEPLDRVIANVQAVLQQQDYYKGEVDGLLGPLTREALVGYQNDNGLYRTAVIDEPTLSSLGME